MSQRAPERYRAFIAATTSTSASALLTDVEAVANAPAAPLATYWISPQVRVASPLELAALSHLFNKAIEWGWIDRRPSKIRRLKEEQGRIVYLTAEQCTRLVEAAKHDQSPHIYPFVVIGLETGMRRMEILSIRIADIDTKRRVIMIPKAKGEPREQPITASLAAILDDYMRAAAPGQVWLFQSPQSSTGHVMNIEKAFRRVATEAGMDPRQVVRHTLRHTAITHLVQANVDIPTVARISGHKTIAMVLRYSHQNGEHIQTAMDKLEARLKLKPAIRTPDEGTVDPLCVYDDGLCNSCVIVPRKTPKMRDFCGRREAASAG